MFNARQLKAFMGAKPFPLSALLQLSGLQFQVFFRVFRVFRGLPPVFRF